MFTNRAGCTIYEKTIQNRAPTYTRRELGAVYWEGTQKQNNGTDRTPQNNAFISIPVTSIGNYLPKKGDRIVDELIADEQPPDTAMTIKAVSDFRFGSPVTQHIEVTAE